MFTCLTGTGLSCGPLNDVSTPIATGYYNSAAGVV